MSWTGIDRPEARSDTGFLPDDGDPGEVLTVGDDGRLEWADPMEFDELPSDGEPGDVLVVGPGGQPNWEPPAAGGIGLNVLAFGAVPDGVAYNPAVGTDNRAAFQAAIAAAASGGTVLVPAGVYRIVGGLIWGSSDASMMGEGFGSIIQCSEQTGAIIDISQVGDDGTFQFGQTISRLMLLGDGVPDPGKTHCGILVHYLSAGISVCDVHIGNTGGPCLKLDSQAHCSSYENISCRKPINAYENDVPWVLINGICNGNVFKNIMCRDVTGDNSGVGGVYRLVPTPSDYPVYPDYLPNNNKFIACQSENIHIPEGGSVVHCQGACNEFDCFIDFDAETWVPTTDTCIIRLVAFAGSTYNGNLGNIVRGFLPGGFGAGGPPPAHHYNTRGIIISSNGNHIHGLSGYPNVIRLTAGATRNYICVAGLAQGSQEYLIEDNSNAINTIINTAERGDFAVNDQMALRMLPGTALVPKHGVFGFDSNQAGTADFRLAEISALNQLANLYESRLTFKITNASGILSEVMRIDGVAGVKVSVGDVDVAGGVLVNGGSFGPSRIYADPGMGLVITGHSGSTNCVYIANAGGTPLLVNPAGTVDVHLGYDSLTLIRAKGRFAILKATPANTAAPGDEGTITWDDGFIYVKTSAGWKRAALSVF